ncbi:MAG: histidinol-phosphatase [Actinobacteria bacterium]|nr:histidinol-phosphatase [Actinomycetota bacterium]MBU1494708.1 histidinol-phosphatase [Actinomycetota bacterium]
MDLGHELQLALELADLADAIALPLFGSLDLAVETKPDATPVTRADRAAERAIRDRLAVARPSHGVVGEEYGTEGPGDARWIIDPIDGTMSFIRGIPVWGALIGLEVEGKMVVGVVSAPAIGFRWWAAAGLGAHRNGGPIRVSTVSDLADAQVSYNSFATAEAHGIGPQMADLERRTWRTRGYGDFWSFMLVAEGAVDVAVEPVGALWDLAPLQPIVEEAGGRFTDLKGNPTPAGGHALATNGILHDEVLALLAAAPGR